MGTPAAATPKDYAAHFQLALAYSLLGRDGDAIPQYKTALELHPGMYEAELNLGLSLMRANHPEEAVDQFKAAAEQREKDEFERGVREGETRARAANGGRSTRTMRSTNSKRASNRIMIGASRSWDCAAPPMR